MMRPQPAGLTAGPPYGAIKIADADVSPPVTWAGSVRIPDNTCFFASSSTRLSASPGGSDSAVLRP
jgi:hypothetical protein